MTPSGLVVELESIASEMSIILPRLSRLSDERDQKYVADLVKRYDRLMYGETNSKKSD